jgi:hypothetical protein
MDSDVPVVENCDILYHFMNLINGLVIEVVRYINND